VKKFIKIREFKKILSGMGASFDRTSGSHEIWKLPNGKTVSIVNGGGELSHNVRKHVKSVFKESGYKDPFDD
jgi:predicted RNA binding protein YcfA (HicA-like mRNA interferase family)